MGRAATKLLFVVALPAALSSQQRPDVEALKQQALAMVEARARLTQQIVDALFSYAELGYQEYESARYLTELLERNGFRVRRGVAGLPTAFVAEWGKGKPVVGLMADIDALPECSQKPGVAYHEPIVAGAPGHGEGHNAGQAVNITAALVAKELMQRYNLPGTIRIYPGIAEELIGSRTYMVLAGLFRDVDAMLSSHIASEFSTSWGGPAGMALVSTQYTFHGRSAHAAGAPWRGASALDAAMLMEVAWNFRREHLNPQHRSHSVIVQGGNQPNVVPSEATIWYYFREWSYEKVRELHAIGSRIARAAAEMTDTTVSERVLAATWPGHFNRPLAEALFANIQRVGMPQWSEQDQLLARAAQKEIGAKEEGLKTKIGELVEAKEGSNYGSDDIAEVSWNVPTVVLRYPANIPGMIAHHWSSAIAMATPIAHKGATAGAKAMVLTILDLLLRPELLEAARAYFQEQTKQIQWKPLIPEGTEPPIHLNREKMEQYRPALRNYYYDPSRYPTYLEQLGIRYPTIKQTQS